MSAAAAHRYRSATNIPHFLCTFSPTMTSSCANFILPFFFSPNKEYFETYIRPPFPKEGGIYPPPNTFSFPVCFLSFFYYFYLTLDIYIYTTESANVLSFNGPGSALTEWSAFDFFIVLIYTPLSLFFLGGEKDFHDTVIKWEKIHLTQTCRWRTVCERISDGRDNFIFSFLFLSVGFSHFNFLR